MKEKIRKAVIDLIFLTVGCVLMAFSVTGILIPNELSAGGITGIARILQNFIPFNYSILFYFIALTVLIISWITLGWKEARKILVMSIMYPVILFIFEHTDFYLLERKDMFLAAIYFGVLNGVGMGLLFRRGYSFGGTDTLSKIINKKVLPFVSMSQLLMFIDGIIIILSGIVYGRNVAMYALVAQLVYTKSIDAILFGFGSQKVKIEIISEAYEHIEQYIIGNINRGVSRYEITGGYTKDKRIMISSICSPRESMLIKNYISHTDSEAFVNVLPINSVWGKGAGFESLMDK